MALIQSNAKAGKTAFLDFSVQTAPKPSGDAGFDQVMKTTKDAPAEAKTETRDAQLPEKTAEQSTVREKLGSMGTKTQEKLALSETEENPEEAAEALACLLADMKQLLMQTFHVSEEELEGVMSELQLTDLDLLEQKGMNQLCAGLAGAENMMELLCNPEFADVLRKLNQEIAGMKQESLNTLGVTEKDMQKLVKQLGQQDGTQLGKEAEAEGMEEPSDTETGTDRLVQPKDQNGNVTAETTVSRDTDSSESEGDFSRNLAQHLTQAEQLMGKVTQAVEEAMPEADAESIVRQLVERVHAAVSEDTSSFEMQLNPEHLGRINLQVIAKDGMVTAQIATENAAVKEALESQISMLKENLSNQGLQVEAVEVTIASHEFERNLDDQQEQNEESRSSQKRRFRFDVMEASEEELTQADMIMRDMMLANGSQINYMA